MRTEDRDYYMRRARAERERAITCEDNAVAAAHLMMADEYERRVRSAVGPDGSLRAPDGVAAA